MDRMSSGFTKYEGGEERKPTSRESVPPAVLNPGTRENRKDQTRRKKEEEKPAN